MTKSEIVKKYEVSIPVNYDVEFIAEQLDILQEIKKDNCISAHEEVMSLNIICSALKYYLEASPEGYGEDIIDITGRLEAIYNIEELLEDLLEVTT